MGLEKLTNTNVIMATTRKCTLQLVVFCLWFKVPYFLNVFLGFHSINKMFPFSNEIRSQIFYYEKRTSSYQSQWTNPDNLEWKEMTPE